MTDETKNLLQFAIRTLFVYKQNASKYNEYEFTLISGAVLNVLSAVYDGKKVNHELKDKLAEGFPHLAPRKLGTLKTDIQQLIHALSAKTKNYHIEKEDRQVAYIEVQSSAQTQSRKYQLDDLKQILDCFESAVLLIEEYHAVYSAEKDEFDRHYSQGVEI